MRLSGKSALITGAGSGMGRAASVAFAREGAWVTVCDVNEASVDATVNLIAAAGGVALGVVADVGKAAQVEGAVGQAVRRFGKLDVLYSNAAIFLPGRGDAPAADLDESVFDRVLSINLKGVWLGAKYAIPEMIKAGGGSIINTSSLAGTRGSMANHAYAMAKGGVISLTQSLAATYGRFNIRANAIAPGAIDTPMIRSTAAMTDAGKQVMFSHLPLGRVGGADEVANLALFLASDESSYVTGTVQVIDGGFTLG